MNDRVILKEDEVDLQKFKEKMIFDDTDALVTLTERARNRRKGDKVKSVKIESYGSTTKNSMHKIKDLIHKRFEIGNIVIIQRLGTFQPGDNIREILISAPDKGDALEALAMANDMTQSHVPMKKKVALTDGREYWVKRADEVMNMYGQVIQGVSGSE